MNLKNNTQFSEKIFSFEAIVFAVYLFILPWGAIYILLYDANDYSPMFHTASFAHIGALVLGMIRCITLLKGRSFRFGGYVPIVLISAAFTLWSWLTLIWAANKFEAMTPLLNVTAAFFILILAMEHFRYPERRALILKAIFFSGVSILILSLVQQYANFRAIPQAVAPAATFGNTTLIAQFFTIIIPIELGLLLFYAPKNRIYAMILRIGIAVTMLLQLFFIGINIHVETAQISAFATIIFLILFCMLIFLRIVWNRPYRNIVLIGMISFLILVIAASIIFAANTAYVDLSEFPKIRFNLQGAFNQFMRRIVIWQNSFGMLTDYPIGGIGIGNWRVFYPGYQAQYHVDTFLTGGLVHEYAHNDFVQFSVELGIVGIILGTLLMITVIYGAIRIVRYGWSAPERLRSPEIIGMCGLVGMSTSALLNFPMQQPALLTIMVILVALIATHDGLRSSKWWHEFSYHPSRIAGSIAVGCAAVLLGLLTVLEVRWNISHHWYRYATYGELKRFGENKSPQLIINRAERAIEYRPSRGEVYYQMGIGYYRIGDYTNAYRNFLKALEIYPYTLHVHRAVGTLALRASNCTTGEEQPADIELANRALESYRQLFKARPYESELGTSVQMLENCIKAAEK